MRRLLLVLYPKSWRRRYGDELAALLEDTPLSPAVVFDTAWHGLRLRLRLGAGAGGRSPGVILALLALCGLCEAAFERAGVTTNVLWAPDTMLRGAALVVTVTPLALALTCAAGRGPGRGARRHDWND